MLYFEVFHLMLHYIIIYLFLYNYTISSLKLQIICVKLFAPLSELSNIVI